MLKEHILNNQAVLGTWCEIPSSLSCNIIAKSGMDFIIIDMEHGAMDFKLAQEMIMAVEAEGCEAIIRVAKNDESSILKALDIGASGVLVPHIKNVSERDYAVASAKFAPIGNRSLNPFIRGMGYSPENLSMKQANQKNLLGIMLEDEQSINNVEEIIDHEAVDLVYLGVYDLAVSMGFGNDITNVKVRKLVELAIKKIIGMKKAVGCMVHSQKEIEIYKNLGVTFLVYKVDASVLYESYKTIKSFLN